MVREKIRRRPDFIEVIYSEEHWKLFNYLRREALSILEIFESNNVKAFVHGSLARGDVWEKSDIDIIIPYVIPSYKIEYLLESHGLNIYSKYIVLATPSSTPKAYIVLDSEERKTISFPLRDFKTREYEFYKFGGLIDYNDLKQNKRVPGVDKRLVFIEPTQRGHIEHPVIGYENIVASKLGISIETVLERIRVLSRRDEIGRTGVYVKYELSQNDSFEKTLNEIARKNPSIRERIDE
ncbi:MAG: nucleotidyltransferase domain-containing protein [Desulfurococcaceae archaeon]|uniref:DNA polymerase subunit beta n=2 Tax=Staphylothermus marinus TaxID=2280 RepID=A0A7C4H985_STAMA